MCEITSKFFSLLHAAVAVGQLSAKPPKRYRNWRKDTICREAISSFQLFALNWAAERAEQNEGETNPVIAFGLQDEVNKMVEYLKDVAEGRTEGNSNDFYAAFSTMYKMWALRDHNATPEEYWELEKERCAANGCQL